MSTQSIHPADVTNAVRQLLASQDESAQPVRLGYLRRKPGRGLVAVYHSASDGQCVATATLEEFAPQRALEAGLTVERFPVDRRLPGLGEAMSPRQYSQLWTALESAANARRPHRQGWTLVDVTAEPLRYKPGDRCVIRYRGDFVQPGARPQMVAMRVIGKLYRERAEAVAADQVLRRLGGMAWSAAPLGILESLPLVLSEDLGAGSDDPPVVAGPQVVRRLPGRSPVVALRAAATALAELHTSVAATAATPLRTATDEAGKALKRGDALSTYAPRLARDVQRVADLLRAGLAQLAPDVAWPAHGSYKPSQLLFREQSVFLVDFDQFCRADPALDVGYFLAYLRPPGLWYGRAGDRQWFEAAAATFLSAYDGELRGRGVGDRTRAGIQARCRVYEAALLLKIAARRVNRLQSPRPGEIFAILHEIENCLDSADRG